MTVDEGVCGVCVCGELPAAAEEALFNEVLAAFASCAAGGHSHTHTHTPGLIIQTHTNRFASITLLIVTHVIHLYCCSFIYHLCFKQFKHVGLLN